MSGARALEPHLVLIDVDGTLVTYANELPASAARAVRRARRAGHRVYPTTGRSRAEMPAELLEVGFDGMIGGNGSYVESDGDVLLHERLSRQDCRAAVGWLTDRGLEFYLETNAGLFPSPGFRQAALPAIRSYIAGKGRADAESVTVEEVLPDLVDGVDPVRDDVNKISFLLEGPEDLEAARRALPALGHGSWGGCGHEALFGDMQVPGVSKVRALEVLREHLGIPLARTVALGDALVDLGMIEHCGVGVAMGNAHPRLKAAADMVTSDADDDGLARAFESLGLLG